MKPIKALFLDLMWSSSDALKSFMIPHSDTHSVGSLLDQQSEYLSQNYVSRVTFNGISTEIIDSFNVKSVDVLDMGIYRICFDRAYRNIGYSVAGVSRLERDSLGFTIVKMDRDYIEIQTISWPPAVYDVHELVSLLIVGEIT